MSPVRSIRMLSATIGTPVFTKGSHITAEVMVDIISGGMMATGLFQLHPVFGTLVIGSFIKRALRQLELISPLAPPAEIRLLVWENIS